MATQSTSVKQYPSLYINGMVVNPYIDRGLLSISSGQCRDSTNKMDILLNTDPNSDSFGEGIQVSNYFTGPGGLDVGVRQNSSLYRIYVISDSSGNKPTQSLCALDNDIHPIIPEGYDAFRLVGYSKTNSFGDFDDNCVNVGKCNYRQMCYLNTQVPVPNLTANVVTRVSMNTFVPIIKDVLATLSVYFTPASDSSTFSMGPEVTTDSFSVYLECYGAGHVIYRQYDLTCELATQIITRPNFYFLTTTGDTSYISVDKFYYNV